MRRIFSLCFSKMTPKFSSEISSKVRRDKERNSHIWLSLLLHNTVGGVKMIWGFQDVDMQMNSNSNSNRQTEFYFYRVLFSHD